LLLFGFTINVVQADNTMERTPVFYVDFEDGTTQDTISGSPASTGMVDIVSN
jgi:hypothetical protein